MEVPVHEGMARYEDYGENFYYIQEDFMFDLAAKRTWNWNIIRPMGIIGYTPAGKWCDLMLFAPLSFPSSGDRFEAETEM